MKWLLDTVTVSESSRRHPNDQVLRWIAAQLNEDIGVSVISFGEIVRGIASMKDRQGQVRLARWYADEFAPAFGGVSVPVSLEVATVWGSLVGAAVRRGQVVKLADGLIAATAVVHSLTVVTRNVKDFEPVGVPVLNPWEPT